MEHYFRSSGYLADDGFTATDGTRFSIGDLPPFLRTLLVADGTVTKSLEAWFWEPVQVVPLKNVKTRLKHRVEGLQANTGDEILMREIRLRGQRSGVSYARARSTLALQALPEDLRRGLLEGKIGIGELLREQYVETYREVIALDYLPAGETAGKLDPIAGSDIVSRSYRIRVRGVPAILVTEYFPLSAYR